MTKKKEKGGLGKGVNALIDDNQSIPSVEQSLPCVAENVSVSEHDALSAQSLGDSGLRHFAGATVLGALAAMAAGAVSVAGVCAVLFTLGRRR